MKQQQQCMSVYRAAYDHLKNIHWLKAFLTQEAFNCNCGPQQKLCRGPQPHHKICIRHMSTGQQRWQCWGTIIYIYIYLTVPKQATAWGYSPNYNPYIYIYIYIYLDFCSFWRWSGVFRGVYSFCTVSSRVSRIYRNKVDSRLHEFGVLKATA